MDKNKKAKGSPIITLLIIAIFVFSAVFYLKTSHPELVKKAMGYLKGGNLETVTAEVFNNITDVSPSDILNTEQEVRFDYLSGYNQPRSVFPLKNATVTSSYGTRVDPVTNKKLSTHHGIDLAAGKGSNILCYTDGVVKNIGYNNIFGNCISVEHNGFSTFYAHLSKITVSEGDSVLAGDTLGIIGSSGKSTGTHLHFEVIKDGQRVDPATYLYEKI